MNFENSTNTGQEKQPTTLPVEHELHSTLDQISFALRGLKFGNVNVIVQEAITNPWRNFNDYKNIHFESA